MRGSRSVVLLKLIVLDQEHQHHLETCYDIVLGNSLVVQWFGLHTSTSEGPRPDPWLGTKI